MGEEWAGLLLSGGKKPFCPPHAGPSSPSPPRPSLPPTPPRSQTPFWQRASPLARLASDAAAAPSPPSLPPIPLPGTRRTLSPGKGTRVLPSSRGWPSGMGTPGPVRRSPEPRGSPARAAPAARAPRAPGPRAPLLPFSPFSVPSPLLPSKMAEADSPSPRIASPSTTSSLCGSPRVDPAPEVARGRVPGVPEGSRRHAGDGPRPSTSPHEPARPLAPADDPERSGQGAPLPWAPGRRGCARTCGQEPGARVSWWPRGRARAPFRAGVPSTGHLPRALPFPGPCAGRPAPSPTLSRGPAESLAPGKGAWTAGLCGS